MFLDDTDGCPLTTLGHFNKNSNMDTRKQRRHKTKRTRAVILRISQTTENIEQQRQIIRKHFTHLDFLEIIFLHVRPSEGVAVVYCWIRNNFTSDSYGFRYFSWHEVSDWRDIIFLCLCYVSYLHLCLFVYFCLYFIYNFMWHLKCFYFPPKAGSESVSQS